MMYWLYSDNEDDWYLAEWTEKSQAFLDDEFLNVLEERCSVFKSSKKDADDSEDDEMLVYLKQNGAEQAFELWLGDERVGFELISKDRNELLWNLFLKWSNESEGESLLFENLDQLENGIAAIFSKPEKEIYFDSLIISKECFQKLKSIQPGILIKDPHLEENDPFLSLINHESFEDYQSGGRAQRLFYESIPESCVAFKVVAQQPELVKFMFECVKEQKSLSRIGDVAGYLRMFLPKQHQFKSEMLPCNVEHFGRDRSEGVFALISSTHSSNGMVSIDVPLTAINFLESLTEDQLRQALESNDYIHFFVGSADFGGLDQEDIVPEWTKRLPVTFRTQWEREMITDAVAADIFGQLFSPRTLSDEPLA
jgi:hypothetical protein